MQVMAAVLVFVGEVQEYVWSRVVRYLCQQVAARPEVQVAERTLEGVIEALERKKITWTMETNMSEFRLQVALPSTSLDFIGAAPTRR